MRMEETCGNGTLPSSSCTAVTKEEEEQVNDNMMPLFAADSSIGCETTNTAESDPSQEKLDKDYCMEATKLILDLGQ